MIVTYLKEKDIYVDQSGRQATVGDYGRDFYKCNHNFIDCGRRGTTTGPNGRPIPAIALQCVDCSVFTVVEVISKIK